MDIETTDALIDCINDYDGGVVMLTPNIDPTENTASKLREPANGSIKETYYEEYHDKVIDEIDRLSE